VIQVTGALDSVYMEKHAISGGFPHPLRGRRGL
jgi:hypothetical protein